MVLYSIIFHELENTVVGANNVLPTKNTDGLIFDGEI